MYAKCLVFSAFTLSSAALAAPYEIDNLAAVPYARQQIAASLGPKAELIGMNTVTPQPDESACAELAWAYVFYSPSMHQTPTDTLGTLGTLRLSLKNVNGTCVWTSEVQNLTQGAPFGGSTLDAYVDQNRLISLDVAVANAEARSSAPVTVVNVDLEPVGDVVVVGSSAYPHYYISGTSRGKDVSFRVDAVTGNVEAATGTTLD